MLDVGGQIEFRLRKAAEDGGGTAFADLVWKPVVLVEMKRRGTDLQKHFRQAFDYWVRITGGRPRYVVLCNFDEFWVYDFDSDLDAPKDKLALTDLPQRWGPLAFLAPGSPGPKFRYDREAVTRISRRQTGRALHPPAQARRRAPARPALHPPDAHRPLCGGH